MRPLGGQVSLPLEVAAAGGSLAGPCAGISLSGIGCEVAPVVHWVGAKGERLNALDLETADFDRAERRPHARNTGLTPAR